MKIIQLVERRQHQGAEIFAAQLSCGLIERGHEVWYAGLFEPPVPALNPAPAQAIDLGYRPRRLDPRIIWRLLRLIHETKPDVVQANGSSTLQYSYVVRLLDRSSWKLLHRNMDGSSYFVASSLKRKVIQSMLRPVDWVASVSEASLLDFVSFYGFPADRASVLPIGVFTEPVFEKTPARAHLLRAAGIEDEAAELVLHVASLTPKKNHAWALETLMPLLRSRPTLHVCLVGEGELRSRIERDIKRRGLSRQVHVLGLRSDVSELMAGADIAILPSLIEGLPAVLVEAAVQGLPSVAHDVGGIREVVRDGDTGRLVPEGDPPAFRAAIMNLLDHPEERRAMGEAARKLAVEEYAMDHIIDGFESLYQELVR